MNSTWNLGTPLVKAQVAMLWHSVLNQVRTSKDQTIIYSSFSTHVSGMHERISHFILCIQSCSLLSPEWLFTTVAGKSAWGWNCVVWGCKMDRQQEKKNRGAQRVCLVFIAKKITSSTERAQSFKIYIPDLFAFIQLINSFWMGFFLGWCAHRCFCYLYNKAAVNWDVIWLK